MNLKVKTAELACKTVLSAQVQALKLENHTLRQ